MQLIIGLGNPGKAYARNRHNIGFRCLDQLSRLHNIPLKERQGHARIGRDDIAGVPVVLAKPQTYVNESGRAVNALVRRYRVQPSDLLVICDDLDLPLGRIRLRPGGSSGGHNGLKSIIAATGSQDFPRIRIGIGRPGEEREKEREVVNHVLGDFSPEEDKVAKEVVTRVVEAVYVVVAEGIEMAMNRFN